MLSTFLWISLILNELKYFQARLSVAYGSSSLTGAINIVTKKCTSSGVSAHAEGGSYGYFNGGARVGLVTGKVSNQISAGYLRSDGFSRNSEGGLNSDYQTVKASYHGTFKSRAADLDWHAGLSARNFGSNTFYSAKFDDQFEHTFKTFASVQAQTRGFVKVKPSIVLEQGRGQVRTRQGKTGCRQIQLPQNQHIGRECQCLDRDNRRKDGTRFRGEERGHNQYQPR